MNFKQKIAELGLPQASYVVVGSGILNALGIRESNDVDLVVSDEVFVNLEKLGWEKGAWGDNLVYKKGVFDVCNQWYGQPVEDLLKNAQIIDGIPYLNLRQVYTWKQQRGQEKDLRDLTLIDTYRKNIHGVITRQGGPDLKDYLIRVSLKAVIFNDQGHVLVVKENGRDWWDIPGGGLDHGESVKEALSRELFEEVHLQGDFQYETILAENPHHIRSHNLYQMRITFLVEPDNLDVGTGNDSDEVMFIDPNLFENSDLINERKIFEYSQLAKNRRKTNLKA